MQITGKLKSLGYLPQDSNFRIAGLRKYGSIFDPIPEGFTNISNREDFLES